MNDMRAVIMPKSDQINADNLLGGPITITITKIDIRPGTEQPVSIHFDGDDGKPYKPCKSMARVMVQCWGPDANQYIGRSMTLYCDPKVQWGGMAVGGIRISHMTHIENAQTMALTATKGSKKPFTVRPLAVETRTERSTDSAASLEPQKRQTISEWLNALAAELRIATSSDAVDAIIAREDVQKAQDNFKNGARDRLNAMVKEAIDRTTPAPAVDDDFPGEVTRDDA